MKRSQRVVDLVAAALGRRLLGLLSFFGIFVAIGELARLIGR